MNISTGVFWYMNSDYTTHSSETHNYSSVYKVIPMKILVDVYVVTGKNDSL